MRFSSVAIGFALILLVPAACSPKIKPGATYTVSIVSKGNDGKLIAQGQALRVETAGVETVGVLTHEGRSFSLLVRKTQNGKATFDVTFPDKTTQMVQLRAGEIKDILPRGQQFGFRIELQESH